MFRFSLPVKRSSMLGSWKTMPIDLRTCVASLTTSKPFTLAMPEVGLRIVQSMLITVVFPAPFGPSKPKISPDSTMMSSLSTAVNPLKHFVSCLVSMMLVNGLVHFQQLESRADLRVYLMREGYLHRMNEKPALSEDQRPEENLTIFRPDLTQRTRIKYFPMILLDVKFSKAL